MSSAKGLHKVSKKELEYFLDGNKKELNWFVFGKEEGMKSEECVGVCQPAGIKDKEGNMWFPTIKGLVFVDPKNINLKPTVFRLYIEGIKVDKELKDFYDGISFPPGRGEMEIYYSGLFFSNPKSLDYRYRLVGFDKDWVYAGKRKVAYYTNLPPKKYIFEISAKLKNFDYMEPIKFSFNLKPHFYQTNIFYLLLLFLFISIIYFIFRIRLNYLKAKTAVLEERARISREIHDTLAQSFAAIVIQSEALKNMETGDKEDLDLRIERIQELAKSGLQEARRSIKSMSSPILQERSLPEAIAYICRNMIGEGPQKLNIKIEGKQKKLKQKVEVNLLRIAQEAVSNAIRHSRATQIDILLTYSEKDVSLSIMDNGIGFDIKSPEFIKGDGLKNMQERAKEISGEFEMESKIGNGTKIFVKLKR